MFLPISINLKERNCLVVGAGVVSAHKCRVLLEHGALLNVVARTFSDDLLWSDTRIRRYHGTYSAEQLSGAILCIAATGDSEINRVICRDARDRGILALNVSAPDECDFIMPAMLRRGAFTVSFATDGLFPALAAKVKRSVTPLFGDDLARICEEARGARQTAQSEEERREALRTLADSAATDWQPQFTVPTKDANGIGKVYLVGAGPGDTGLITLKGAQCLRNATVVIHDALANGELLDLFCQGARRIDVSKRKGMCLHMQPEINQMLIDWARQRHTVVRLKGGDPMIFGRGGEEARALFAASIPFEIVPGVSSLSAVPAYAGIPVTDREFGSASMGVFSLHRRGNAGLTEPQWQSMANSAETLVFFMGLSLLSTVVEKLLTYGHAPDESIALITQGTSPQQTEIVATLSTILTRPELKTIEGPGLIVVGNVVRSYGLMNWFSSNLSQPTPQPIQHSCESGVPH